MVDQHHDNEWNEEPIELPAEKARGAEIVFRNRGQRIVFFAGLAGFVVLVLVLYFLSAHS